ncbi:hypothetical protein B0J12DRAFT_2217 [Macrophomina phaseolina]|uniref:Secreted protein n=1 Tax=Macrophomina phaseolina TaxID=35725 RepID=A0ABQ8GTI9_9PEZI|nr:hypothetical protein B0J12DRAFT_2217 [Macrophomina phaseolina]
MFMYCISATWRHLATFGCAFGPCRSLGWCCADWSGPPACSWDYMLLRLNHDSERSTSAEVILRKMQQDLVLVERLPSPIDGHTTRGNDGGLAIQRSNISTGMKGFMSSQMCCIGF